MTTDNKTLADAQPGGRVRLGDQAERAGDAGDRKYVTAIARALRAAYRHLDMGSMRVSHCNDAAIIEAALKEIDTFDLNAAIAALFAQPSPGVAVPAGWKLVPIEPTWNMRNDGREFLIDGIEKEPERLAYFLWKTMINAAPEVQ